MPEAYESELLSAFEGGALKSVAKEAELAKFKAVARATAVNDTSLNIRLSERATEPSPLLSKLKVGRRVGKAEV
jgi:hypothetical protein